MLFARDAVKLNTKMPHKTALATSVMLKINRHDFCACESPNTETVGLRLRVVSFFNISCHIALTLLFAKIIVKMNTKMPHTYKTALATLCEVGD